MPLESSAPLRPSMERSPWRAVSVSVRTLATPPRAPDCGRRGTDTGGPIRVRLAVMKWSVGAQAPLTRNRNLAVPPAVLYTTSTFSRVVPISPARRCGHILVADHQASAALDGHAGPPRTGAKALVPNAQRHGLPAGDGSRLGRVDEHVATRYGGDQEQDDHRGSQAHLAARQGCTAAVLTGADLPHCRVPHRGTLEMDDWQSHMRPRASRASDADGVPRRRVVYTLGSGVRRAGATSGLGQLAVLGELRQCRARGRPATPVALATSPAVIDSPFARAPRTAPLVAPEAARVLLHYASRSRGSGPAASPKRGTPIWTPP